MLVPVRAVRLLGVRRGTIVPLRLRLPVQLRGEAAPRTLGATITSRDRSDDVPPDPDYRTIAWARVVAAFVRANMNPERDPALRFVVMAPYQGRWQVSYHATRLGAERALRAAILAVAP